MAGLSYSREGGWGNQQLYLREGGWVINSRILSKVGGQSIAILFESGWVINSRIQIRVGGQSIAVFEGGYMGN